MLGYMTVLSYRTTSLNIQHCVQLQGLVVGYTAEYVAIWLRFELNCHNMNYRAMGIVTY